jgi:hypothetical protein
VESRTWSVGAAGSENETSRQHPAVRPLVEPWIPKLCAAGCPVERSGSLTLSHDGLASLCRGSGSRSRPKPRSGGAFRDSLDGLALVRPRRGKRSCSHPGTDGARIVEMLDVLSKTYGKGFLRELKISNHPNHMRHDGSRRFYLAVFLERPTPAPRYDISRLTNPCIIRQCACDSCARRLPTAASVNDGRTVVRTLQTERSASDTDNNWTALYAPPTARFTELGMSASLTIFIQLQMYNGGRIASHLCQDTIRPDANPVTAKRPYPQPRNDRHHAGGKGSPLVGSDVACVIIQSLTD